MIAINERTIPECLLRQRQIAGSYSLRPDLNTQYPNNGNLVHIPSNKAQTSKCNQPYAQQNGLQYTTPSSLYTTSFTDPRLMRLCLSKFHQPHFPPPTFPQPPNVPAKFILANASLFQLSSPLPGPSSSSSLVIGSALTTLNPPLCPALPSTPPSLISWPDENPKSQLVSCSRPSTAGRWIWGAPPPLVVVGGSCCWYCCCCCCCGGNC